MTPKIAQQLQQINQDLDELVEELKKFSEAELCRCPGDGQWSALQTMYHLVQAEALSLKYVQKKLSYSPDLKNTDWKNHLRLLVMRIFFKLPFKIKAPKQVDGHQLPPDLNFDLVSKEWMGQRKRLEDYFKTLPPEVFGKSLFKHPVAGRLDLSGMLTFYQTHFDRHKKQIFDALRS